MRRPQRARFAVFGLLLLLAARSVVSAQSAQSGAIAGVVRDASGAVLPGVTVEAASPALIEKVRSVITDNQGRYSIVELRPGTYTVTFTLPGFATFRREGLELTTGFTATVNADLKIGALEETVTVTGASPVVDVQNVRTQTVLSRQVLETLPTGKTLNSFATLTLGVTAISSPTIDVGGNKGETFFGFGVHGSAAGDGKVTQDGMQINEGAMLSRRNQVNQVAVQEVTIETRGMSAESETGGVRINMVPRDGGNTLRPYFDVSASHPRLQASNLTEEHRNYGVTQVNTIKALYDVGGGLGGPIRKDLLWFYTAHRWWGTAEYNAGRFFNATPEEFFYTEDRSRRAYNEYTVRDHSLRLTWQAAEKHKLAGSVSYQANCTCYKLSGGVDLNRSPEASVDSYYKPEVVTQATWNFPATNRLLFEAGLTHLYDNSDTTPTRVLPANAIAKEELTTGFNWGASIGNGGSGNNYGVVLYKRLNTRASLSYVTGSHSFKVGMMTRDYWSSVYNSPFEYNVPPYELELRNGAPSRITLFAYPLSVKNEAWEAGLFAQDQWTLRRLTLNLGVRFDQQVGTAKGERVEASMFRAATDFQDIHDVPNHKDITTRLGAAYDLFGNSKTALKVSVGKYLSAGGSAGGPTLTNANNPANRIADEATRTWTDVNRNFRPDCDLTNPLQNGECGQISDLNLGTPRLGTNYDLDVLRGWGKRFYNWQVTASVQHELAGNVGVALGYYRTWFGNFTVTDNLAVTPADFDHYCITAPNDPRLPMSGQRLCGLYDVTPSMFGQVNNFVTFVDRFGERSQVYDGFDVNLNTRVGGGRLLQGGVSFGRTVDDNCVIVDSPQAAREGFCKVAPPWSSTAQVKLAGVYPLPWNLQASATLQNISAFPITATRTTPSSEIAPSLGRNLAAGATGTAAIPLIPDNTLFGDRLTQIDVRLTRIFRVGRAKVRGMFDVYNLFNAGTTINVNNNYGLAWLRPITIVGARMVKFAGQLDW